VGKPFRAEPILQTTGRHISRTKYSSVLMKAVIRCTLLSSGSTFMKEPMYIIDNFNIKYREVLDRLCVPITSVESDLTRKEI
jgi:hypothetical protein